MADREHLLGNPRYTEVATQLRGDPLFSKIWQVARARARCVEESYPLNELAFAFEPRYVTFERDPSRTYDFPGEDLIKYGTQILLVCKFPSMLAGENEVVELYTDDDDLKLSDDELLCLVEIATGSEEEHRYI